MYLSFSVPLSNFSHQNFSELLCFPRYQALLGQLLNLIMNFKHLTMNLINFNLINFIWGVNLTYYLWPGVGGLN